MKKLLTILITILVLQAPSLADDISDFQIEGISIGDSLLDYFSEEEIKAKGNFVYKSKKFITFSTKSKSNVYERLQVNYKSKDKKYLIHGVSGYLRFDNNMKACKKKKKEIVRELKDIFKDIKIIVQDKKHDYDKSGKTMVYGTFMDFKSGGYSDVYCTDWSNELTQKNGWYDALEIKIGSEEFDNFLRNEAYK
tara:strand:- start:20 stop:601 length:582 start_codon:yes stop_codon:yes gene_type:complete